MKTCKYLIEILPSCTPDIPIPNASTDPNELEIKATLEDPPSISTIDTPDLQQSTSSLSKPTPFTNFT